MCEHLTIETRQDGTISAKCAIRTADQNSQDSQNIMAIYEMETGNTAMPNGECQFYYCGITQICPCNN